MKKPTLKEGAVTSIGRGYDRVAGFYNTVVKLVFGDTLIAIQRNALEQMESVEHITIIGGGSGALLEVLIHQAKAKHYTYIEASEEMLNRTKNRLSTDQRSSVSFLVTSPDKLQTDLIIYPFVLDCYSEQEVTTLLDEAKGQLKPNGKVLIVDFNLETQHGFNGGWIHRNFLSLLYIFFRLVGGTRTSQLPPIFSIADAQLGGGVLLSHDNRRWILGKCYSMESR